MSFVYSMQYQITHGEKPTAFRFLFACAHPTIEALAVALAANGVVSGERLSSVADGRGGQMIRTREPFAAGVAGLVAIQPPRGPVWEPEA